MTETMESKSGHEGLPESNQPQVSEQLFYCLNQNIENEGVYRQTHWLNRCKLGFATGINFSLHICILALAFCLCDQSYIGTIMLKPHILGVKGKIFQTPGKV